MELLSLSTHRANGDLDLKEAVYGIADEAEYTLPLSLERIKLLKSA